MSDQSNVEKTLDESIKDLVFSAQLMSSYDQMQKVLVKGLEALIASEATQMLNDIKRVIRKDKYTKPMGEEYIYNNAHDYTLQMIDESIAALTQEKNNG